jgi:hypothetical protein
LRDHAGVTPEDQRRSAALLAWPNRADVDPETLPPALLAPFAAASTPTLPRRFLQALAVKRGRLSWEASIVAPLLAARREAFGAAAGGPPRPLVRVDELPHARGFDPKGRFGTDAYRRFHAVFAEAGVPYLLAVTPRVSREYLDPEVEEWRDLDDAELELMRELKADGNVAFALHGLDHRSRASSPRRRSEFCGLRPAAAAERVDLARRRLEEIGLSIPVFVAPFNRFDPGQYDLLAERFDVVCGGPESIRLLGFAPTPVWRGEAVYLPSYAPLYARSGEVEAGLRRLEADEAALWAPITLHWGWELEDDFAGLRRLCDLLAGGHNGGWGEFLGAVTQSREG